MGFGRWLAKYVVIPGLLAAVGYVFVGPRVGKDFMRGSAPLIRRKLDAVIPGPRSTALPAATKKPTAKPAPGTEDPENDSADPESTDLDPSDVGPNGTNLSENDPTSTRRGSPNPADPNSERTNRRQTPKGPDAEVNVSVRPAPVLNLRRIPLPTTRQPQPTTPPHSTTTKPTTSSQTSTD